MPVGESGNGYLQFPLPRGPAQQGIGFQPTQPGVGDRPATAQHLAELLDGGHVIQGAQFFHGFGQGGVGDEGDLRRLLRWGSQGGAELADVLLHPRPFEEGGPHVKGAGGEGVDAFVEAIEKVDKVLGGHGLPGLVPSERRDGSCRGVI